MPNHPGIDHDENTEARHARLITTALAEAHISKAAAVASADTAAAGVERVVRFSHRYMRPPSTIGLRTTVAADVLATATGRLLLDLDLDTNTGPWEETVSLEGIVEHLSARGYGTVARDLDEASPTPQIDLYWNWHTIAMRLPAIG